MNDLELFLMADASFLLQHVVSDWAAGLESYGYIGLFLASFLAATVLPFASEGLIGGMVYSGFDPNWCIVIASVGNWLGSLTTYGLGRLGKWSWLEKYFGVKPQNLNQARWYMDRYGVYSALLSWAPVIGDVIAVALGYFKVTFWKVSLLLFVGKFLRYLILVYIVLGVMSL